MLFLEPSPGMSPEEGILHDKRASVYGPWKCRGTEAAHKQYKQCTIDVSPLLSPAQWKYLENNNEKRGAEKEGYLLL